MKKLALTLCALGTAMQVQAQSSVTIFGNVDLNLTYARVGDTKATLLDQGGNKVPSRIGFRGVEDLGGGLSASFWLETAVLPDSGAVQGAFFGRRSTVSLASRDLGELRFGRDYVATFWNVSNFAPFGTVGAGGSSNIILGWPSGLGASTMVRASNSIGYFLPRNSLGVYGQLTYGFSENVDGAKYTGGRIGYASGPLDVAAAYGWTPSKGEKYKTWTIGGTYDFKVTKLFVNYLNHQRPAVEQANLSVGVSVPVGPGNLLASYAVSDMRGGPLAADDASMAAIGYVYPLSKRTDIYTTYSRIDNKGNAEFTTTDSPSGMPGRKASAFQVGVTHRF